MKKFKYSFKDSNNKTIKIGDTVVFKPSTHSSSIISRGKVISLTDCSIRIKYKSKYSGTLFTNIYNTSQNVIIIRKA